MTAVQPTPPRDFHGHTMVRTGNFWHSRTPFTRGNWQYNAGRMQDAGKGYFVLEEKRVVVGDTTELHYSLNGFPNLDRFRRFLGADVVGEDFGSNEGRGGKTEVVYNKDYTIVGGQFYLLNDDEVGMSWIRHPMTGGTHFHYQAMCLAIGADMMTYKQLLSLANGRQHFTPNGQLDGPNGKEYAVTSIKEKRESTVDVEDSAFLTDPETNTRHYTGNVALRMRRDENKFTVVGGSCFDYHAEVFAVSGRGGGHPDYRGDDVGFLASARVQD